MRKSFLILSLLLVLGGAAVGGLWRKALPVSQTSNGDRILESFNEAALAVDQNYAQPVDKDALTRDSLTEALHSLDPHSNFFSRHDFQQMNEEQSGRFYGIGISINRRNGRVYLLTPTPGAPADRAGLRYGDAVLKIDGEDASNWDSQDVQNKVRGQRGEAVTITVERVGEPKPLDIKIVRDAVPYPSVRGTLMLRPGIGYIGLSGGFNRTTEEELSEAIDKLRGEGMRQLLVLDLRNNPGGLLDEAIGVSKKFLRSGQTIVSVKGRNFRDTVHQSDNPQPDDIPLVVLVNRLSASASEIVAGAIQDHDRGLVVGETTFGKGLVQNIFYEPFGTGLLLTTAKYYTPSGRSIQRDYSGGSYYSYIRGIQDTTSGPEIIQASRKQLQTDGGRPVFGGGGITPDIEVKAPDFDAVRASIFGGTFEFVRQLTAGQIKGFESYKIGRPKPNHSFKGDEYPINEKLLAAYRDFANKNQAFQLSEQDFTANLVYLQSRIREELVLTAYGSDAGQLIALDADPQLLKALDALPQARQLAQNVSSDKKPGS